MIDESWLLEKNGRTISSAVTGVKAGPSGPSKPGSDRADRSRLPGTARLDGAEPSGYLRSQAPPSGCRVGARSARVWAQASCSGRWRGDRTGGGTWAADVRGTLGRKAYAAGTSRRRVPCARGVV